VNDLQREITNSPPVGDAEPLFEVGLSDHGDPSAQQCKRANAR
jgi:hypothetical protein